MYHSTEINENDIIFCVVSRNSFVLPWNAVISHPGEIFHSNYIFLNVPQWSESLRAASKTFPEVQALITELYSGQRSRSSNLSPENIHVLALALKRVFEDSNVTVPSEMLVGFARMDDRRIIELQKQYEEVTGGTRIRYLRGVLQLVVWCGVGYSAQGDRQ